MSKCRATLHDEASCALPKRPSQGAGVGAEVHLAHWLPNQGLWQMAASPLERV